MQESQTLSVEVGNIFDYSNKGGSKVKRNLDRFDNSPLWIRVYALVFIPFILVAGLYTR